MTIFLLRLAGIQGLILGIALLRKKTNIKANRILSLVTILLGGYCFFYSFNNLNFYIKYPHLIRIDWGLLLIIAPLMYLYTLYLINQEHKWFKKMYMHFFPYVLNLLILLPFFMKSGEEKIQILDYFSAMLTIGTDSYSTYSFLLYFSIACINIFYVYRCISTVKKHEVKIKNEYSQIEKFKIRKLYNILYAYGILSFIFILSSIVIFGNRYPTFDYNLYYFIFMSLVIYWLSYQALEQPFEIYSTNQQESTTDIFKRTTEQDLIKAEEIRSIVKEKKLFLNSDLTASQLANLCDISRHDLSHILNMVIKKKFYDFINDYRVEEFKNRIQSKSNSKLTLLGIAYESGFNSKTTFNVAFKKNTGFTPSQFKKNLQK